MTSRKQGVALTALDYGGKEKVAKLTERLNFVMLILLPWNISNITSWVEIWTNFRKGREEEENFDSSDYGEEICLRKCQFCKNNADRVLWNSALGFISLRSVRDRALAERAPSGSVSLCFTHFGCKLSCSSGKDHWSACKHSVMTHAQTSSLSCHLEGKVMWVHSHLL